ncbi:hypothetical protein WPS_28290 [Vulcanimicrobium alpinum]|uniref:Uncharacterized protein n=1 Tax=Vulcanimicrobium alpinum TaxID=3016050 RepID=A0AAN1XZX3_UNVUL|nr:hypothetical protein [Vulcanimicrobium alpinum]BDE07553.1 hypothetical protein WPS_28290 [Vulcanimicrobium alpinum]
MRWISAGTVVLMLFAASCAAAPASHDVPKPAACDATVNKPLGDLVAQETMQPVDNVMVCGTTIGPSRPQRAGAHGGHQLIPLRAPVDGGSVLVEVVTNDELDGRVTAPRGATVFAYGQYFHTSRRQRPFKAGIHDVHCATHRGADNGWVVVNGVSYPRGSCPLY